MAAGVSAKLPEKLPREAVLTYSSLQLAFLGDAVFELIIRSVLLRREKKKTGDLSKETARLVNAGAQAKMAKALLPYLSEEEKAVYRRAKNAKPTAVPKHQRLSDYHKATGLEALCGYLFLRGERERLLFLAGKGLRFMRGEAHAG